MYIRVFCIHTTNKLFDMIPRLKHDKDVINIPFVEFRLKLKKGTIPFHSDTKKHLLGLGLKGYSMTPWLLHLFDDKECCQNEKRLFSCS